MMEGETPIPSWEGSSFKGGDASHPQLFCELL